jgi:hypothetical protein
MTTNQGNEPVTVEAIAMRAYELYEARGGEDGHDVEDWQQAEAELTGGRGWQQSDGAGPGAEGAAQPDMAGQPDERSP